MLLAEPGVHEADWSRLRYVIYGSSPIPEPVIAEATRVLGCQFFQSYGLTETTGGVTILDGADHVTGRRLRSAGRSFWTTEVKVVDPETLADVPPGTRGEVLVRGPQVMKGYWRNPEATAAAITPEGWFRTGDGGSVDADGYLFLHDRLKDMIVSGGENVFPAEVESVMTGHPGIAQVAVVGVPSERWGESPLAVVVRAPGDQSTAEELLAWTRERLAHYKCPVAVEFVDALPTTASGKLLKHELRATYAARS
jgi:acyl-CoA synthetase (AMP-forming)/AMP-acid ligase II